MCVSIINLPPVMGQKINFPRGVSPPVITSPRLNCMSPMCTRRGRGSGSFVQDSILGQLLKQATVKLGFGRSGTPTPSFRLRWLHLRVNRVHVGPIDVRGNELLSNFPRKLQIKSQRKPAASPSLIRASAGRARLHWGSSGVIPFERDAALCVQCPSSQQVYLTKMICLHWNLALLTPVATHRSSHSGMSNA